MKKRESPAVANCVVVSDLHLGCQFALCPPRVRLDGGGEYVANDHQRWLWDRWREFWNEWVPDVTRGEPYCVVINGDIIDNRHHHATTHVSENLADQRRLAVEIIGDLRERAGGRLYVVRGTPVHSGETGEDEETIAEQAGAVHRPGTNAARNDLWLRLGRGLVHFLHHIGTSGSLHYETTGIMKEYAETCSDAARWRKPVPDVVVRSHRHKHIEVRCPTSNGYGIAFVTSSWQLKTPLAYRIAGARVTLPTVGGSLIRCGDEDVYTRHKTWYLDRSAEETP